MRFLRVGDRRVAYEVHGPAMTAEPPLVVPAWWVSHLELDWHDQRVQRFWAGVAAGRTLVRYDRLGVGMSDRTVDDADLTLDAEVATLRMLCDELGAQRVSLLGGSSGSATAIAFAATHPDRVDRLVLYGAYPSGDQLTPPGVAEAIVAAVQAHWGLGSRLLSDIFLGGSDAAENDRFARLQRASASAQTAAALLGMVYRLDVRSHLSGVRAPTTVVHRRADRAVPQRLGRDVAAAIPGASFTMLEGESHFPWHGDVDSVVRACREGLAASVTTAVAAQADPLSTREREILGCVARGLSDREIADRLSISPHTVHRHVANIRHKLGSPSRTAAVAEATRRGLL
ncbi:alpha/beta fold hydrolase [Mycolicibacterium sp. 018/SC-01/001]|uniref:alpha/beta fold hydrolase n=1 Tax=Mycolicibacterium sp. 018/SC-01/001 TaxID=2592069 RepID=UPI0011802ECB|nr:alpha/beta fold hydrolase [Mycolicibacterium sp. 018/SC-01/001]TRW89072.1 alpha/beta fold hydrolase [Mycolicibacterium sp. 018/SC-01/001]